MQNGKDVNNRSAQLWHNSALSGGPVRARYAPWPHDGNWTVGLPLTANVSMVETKVGPP